VAATGFGVAWPLHDVVQAATADELVQLGVIWPLLVSFDVPVRLFAKCSGASASFCFLLVSLPESDDGWFLGFSKTAQKLKLYLSCHGLRCVQRCAARS
jgi:hypothetical protein